MRSILLVLLVAIASHLQGQELQPPSLFDSLYSLPNLEITLTYPYDSLYRTKRDEIAATLSIKSASWLLLQDEPISLNIRGKFRRMHCKMPPILLNFKKNTLRNLNLSPIDEMKLVTHCIDGEAGQDNLQEERLCYQLYESLTSYAYRHIWVTVQYCDATEPGHCYTSAGILLEPDKVMEKRLGIQERKLYNVAQDSLEFESYARVAAFNFLIGNRDWSIVSSRNAKLFYQESLKKYVVIPYDFDYSNLVGATYRKETLPSSMDHPFDRLYDGEYFKEKSRDILQAFLSNENQLLGMVDRVATSMNPERRAQIRKYLETWFGFVKKQNPEKWKYGLVCPYKGGL